MTYHYIRLAEQWNEIVWDGPNMDVAEATACIIDLATVYHYVAATGEWLVYNPTWPAGANTLHTLEYGKAYWVAVDTYPQDWLVPDYQPGEVYTAGAYFAYAPGMEGGYGWRDDWAGWIKDMAKKETGLFAELCGGTISVIFAERWIVPRKMGTGEEIYSYWKAMGIETSLPHGTEVDLPIVFYMDELASGMCAYDNIAVVRATAVQRTIDARAGEYAHIEDYLPHELGHIFGLGHCSNKPCIMVPGINWESYQQWLDYGQKLYVCDSHRPTLIHNWDNSNIEEYQAPTSVFTGLTIKDYQKV
ncbi:MAG TPA: hypothetical protein DIT43_01840 [Dehalococcoidia bacterium]|nr:hypothetical protein [Dehalococcoidia bacterium]